jgi:hypothetical protein
MCRTEPKMISVASVRATTSVIPPGVFLTCHPERVFCSTRSGSRSESKDLSSCAEFELAFQNRRSAPVVSHCHPERAQRTTESRSQATRDRSSCAEYASDTIPSHSVFFQVVIPSEVEGSAFYFLPASVHICSRGLNPREHGRRIPSRPFQQKGTRRVRAVRINVAPQRRRAFRSPSETRQREPLCFLGGPSFSSDKKIGAKRNIARGAFSSCLQSTSRRNLLGVRP